MNFYIITLLKLKVKHTYKYLKSLKGLERGFLEMVSTVGGVDGTICYFGKLWGFWYE